MVNMATGTLYIGETFTYTGTPAVSGTAGTDYIVITHPVVEKKVVLKLNDDVYSGGVIATPIAERKYTVTVTGKLATHALEDDVNEFMVKHDNINDTAVYLVFYLDATPTYSGFYDATETRRTYLRGHVQEFTTRWVPENQFYEIRLTFVGVQ